MIRKTAKRIKKAIRIRIYRAVYKLCCLLPLEDKVVGSSFYGKKYENNTKFVMDKLECINPGIKKVWIKKSGHNYDTPDYVKAVTGDINAIWEYATAKVWIDTHNIPRYISKRKGQIYIYCYHAGLLIKKIAADVNKNDTAGRHNAESADIFISNADTLDGLIRTALQFHGPIWKTGLPKNDPFSCNDNSNERSKIAKRNVLKYYGIDDPDTNIMLYAPTHRRPQTMLSALNIDFDLLKSALKQKYGENWIVMLRLHPANILAAGNLNDHFGEAIIDVDHYPDMQELILSSDAFISDYSSTIFDVAERGIPCFIYASDIEEFKKENRDLYFAMEEMPFPLSESSQELENIILTYDQDHWMQKWKDFADRCGLCDKGNASSKIAELISDYMAKGPSALEGLEFIWEEEQNK